jgi:hypothetical protein
MLSTRFVAPIPTLYNPRGEREVVVVQREVEMNTNNGTNNRLRLTRNTPLPAALPDLTTWNDNDDDLVTDEPSNEERKDDDVESSDAVVVVTIPVIAFVDAIETEGFLCFIIALYDQCYSSGIIRLASCFDFCCEVVTVVGGCVLSGDLLRI